MQLTITLRELSPIVHSLNNFVQVPIPAKYSWRLSKVMKRLQSEVEEFNKSRAALFEKYGEEIDADNVGIEGKQLRIKEENMDVFYSEFNELLSESITISFNPIPISLIESSMTIADMANLSVFFEDDDENSSKNVEE